MKKKIMIIVISSVMMLAARVHASGNEGWDNKLRTVKNNTSDTLYVFYLGWSGKAYWDDEIGPKEAQAASKNEVCKTPKSRCQLHNGDRQILKPGQTLYMRGTEQGGYRNGFGIAISRFKSFALPSASISRGNTEIFNQICKSSNGWCYVNRSMGSSIRSGADRNLIITQNKSGLLELINENNEILSTEPIEQAYAASKTLAPRFFREK